MSYTIIKSDGTLLTTIADGTLDTTCSLQLPGPNYVGYGQHLNENLVHLLESFAGNSAPGGNNLLGQLWFNKSNQVLNVFTTEGYVPVSGIVLDDSQPVNAIAGNIWFNTQTAQLYFFDGTNWNLIGPNYTKLQGVSGAIPAVINDATVIGLSHNVLELKFGGTLIGILSSDLVFVPSPAIPGFPVINPGLTLNNTLINTNLNTNVTGSLTGNVTGNLVGNTVIASSGLFGHLTGNVTGDITGNITATTVIGSLTGNVTSNFGRITNFSTGNAQITGGNITSVGNVSATTGTFANVTTQVLSVTSGNITGITNGSVTNLFATNFSTGNAVITGGYINNLSNIAASSATFTSLTVGSEIVGNMSIANAVITGGYISNLSNIAATIGTFSSVVTGAVTASAGTLSGLTSVTTSNVHATTATVSNIQATSGNISNIVGANNTFTTANLVNSVATTKDYSDSSTAIATTAFVQSVLPRGMIIMWGGSVVSIPAGWQLCDGSNTTPDLRNKFIVGAGTGVSPSAYAVGATGGTTSVTLAASNIPAHTHTFSGTTSISGTTGSGTAALSDPGHRHQQQTPREFQGTRFTDASGQDTWEGYGFFGDYTATVTSGIADNGHTHGFSATGSFSGNTGSIGSGTAFNTVPPYYALCYIQKMF